MTVEENSEAGRKVDFKNPEVLRRLYWDERLSLKKIAALAGTTTSHIHYYMTKFGISRREWSGVAPKRELWEIHQLYRKQRKTIRETAQALGIASSTVRKHLLRHGWLRDRAQRPVVDGKETSSSHLTLLLDLEQLPPPGMADSDAVAGKATIEGKGYDSEELRRLYWEKHHNIRQIARELPLERRLVREAILRLGPTRPRKIARSYWKGPFSGNADERSYLLGLRAGDLNVVRVSRRTVMARISTTHQAMLELFEKTFFPYATCVTTPRRVFLTGYDWQIRAQLDDTFAFLIEKPSSLPVDRDQLYSFLAGLSDSDGSWSLVGDKGKAKCSFSIVSESRVLLEEVKKSLEKECFHTYLYLSRREGTEKVLRGASQTRQIKLSTDMWNLEIHRREEVRVLARRLLPFSRHREKVRKMCLVLDERNEGWDAMAPKVEALRRSIREETANTIRRAEIEYKARHDGAVSGVVG